MSGGVGPGPGGGRPAPGWGAGRAGVERYRGPEYRRLLTAARRSLERTGGSWTGRISVADPDDAERKAIIGITGVHQPAGTRRLTVSLEALAAAVGPPRDRLRAGVDLLTELGGPLREPARGRRPRWLIHGPSWSPWPRRARSIGSHEWYRQWLGELRQDGTLTRLASQGDDGLLGQAVRALEFLDGLPRGRPRGPIALPALAATITGDTKALNHGTGLATLVLRALALRAQAYRGRGPPRSGGTCGTGPGSWSTTWPAGSWC